MALYEDYYGRTVHIPENELDGVWTRYIATRDEGLRDRLLDHYKELVFQIAERLVQSLPRHVDVLDLITPGLCGLINAIERYNPELNCKFATFANLRVRGAIYDELRRWDTVPRSIRQQAGRIEEARGELEARLGRPPGEEELAARLGVPVATLRIQLRDARVPSVMSLDRKWNEDDDHELDPAEMLADRRAVNPLGELLRAELKQEALRGLNEDEKKVLVLYYYEELNMKEIGEIINKSESRVCQIHQQTINFLQSRRDQLREREGALT